MKSLKTARVNVNDYDILNTLGTGKLFEKDLLVEFV